MEPITWYELARRHGTEYNSLREIAEHKCPWNLFDGMTSPSFSHHSTCLVYKMTGRDYSMTSEHKRICEQCWSQPHTYHKSKQSYYNDEDYVSPDE